MSEYRLGLPSDLTFLILNGVRKNGVAKARVGQARQHRRLHHGDDLAGLGANHREAVNAVIVTHQRLHETLSFGRLRPQHSADR
jgi:hypothetical protein